MKREAARSPPRSPPLSLRWAANNGHVGAAAALVAAGADVDAAARRRVGLGARRASGPLGDEAEARLFALALPGRPADLDAPDDARPRWVDVDRAGADGETPLYRAAHQGYEDVVRLLLSRRADKGRANARGERPADVVCRGGNHQNAHAIAALLR